MTWIVSLFLLSITANAQEKIELCQKDGSVDVFEINFANKYDVSLISQFWFKTKAECESAAANGFEFEYYGKRRATKAGDDGDYILKSGCSSKSVVVCKKGLRRHPVQYGLQPFHD